MLAPEGEERQAGGMVVWGVSDRMYGRLFTRGVESEGIRIRERGDSTVVFVAGDGLVEGAFAEAGAQLSTKSLAMASPCGKIRLRREPYMIRRIAAVLLSSHSSRSSRSPRSSSRARAERPAHLRWSSTATATAVPVPDHEHRPVQKAAVQRVERLG